MSDDHPHKSDILVTPPYHATQATNNESANRAKDAYTKDNEADFTLNAEFSDVEDPTRNEQNNRATVTERSDSDH